MRTLQIKQCSLNIAFIFLCVTSAFVIRTSHQENNYFQKLTEKLPKNRFFCFESRRRRGKLYQNSLKFDTYGKQTLFNQNPFHFFFPRSTSGFTPGFIMSGSLFGHFRRQGVKILKCYKPTFYSKITKEHDGTTQNSQF